MIVITAPPALGQRDGRSGPDWIRCLIDGYDMEVRFGLQCGVVGTIKPHYRTPGNTGAVKTRVVEAT